MKFLKSLVVFLFVISGCSFKKDSTSPTHDTTEGNKAVILSAFEAIYSGNPKDVKDSLSSFTRKQLADLNVDGTSLIDAAIARGNSHILKVLLDRGISPFTTNSKDNVKPYLRIHKLNSDMSDSLGYWIYLKWLETFQKRDIKKIAADLESLEVTCVDMLNLYSWYSQISQGPLDSTDFVIEIANRQKCLKNLSNSQMSLILTNELVGLARGQGRTTEFLTFLIKSPQFKNALLSFKLGTGGFTIKPHSFIRIVSSLDAYKENLNGERLADLLSFFEEDKNEPIKVYTGPNKTLTMTIYSFDAPEEKDLITSAMSLTNLGQSEGCFLFCNITTNPEVHEGF